MTRKYDYSPDYEPPTDNERYIDELEYRLETALDLIAWYIPADEPEVEELLTNEDYHSVMARRRHMDQPQGRGASTL